MHANFVISLIRSFYIYVIHRPGGPYWEKLCPRSRVRPERTRDSGYSFSQYVPTKAGDNIFIYF